MNESSYFYYDNCNTYNEFLTNASNELNIDVNDYFFYYQNDNKKYGIFNDISFQKFKNNLKEQNKVKISYENKNQILKKNFNNTINENVFDSLSLKCDNITNQIDDIIDKYLDRYLSCLREIYQRNEDISKTKLENLKKISYNEDSNEKFIEQITYENVIKNCRSIASPEDNNSKFFIPQQEETCNYCKTNNINQLYGCEKCNFKICEYCFQSLQIYQHFHKISIYKTN